MDVKPGERVLDLCAAPGGKTTLMADRTSDEAMIIAADCSKARMATVVATTRLHQLKWIRPVLLDAVETLPFRAGSFDKVLVYAPCSGTGTLRRNPEIRWRLAETDIGAFAEVQKQILRNAIEAVKPGGRLVYSTCSVEVEENEQAIQEVMIRDDLFKTIRTW